MNKLIFLMLFPVTLLTACKDISEILQKSSSNTAGAGEATTTPTYSCIAETTTNPMDALDLRQLATSYEATVSLAMSFLPIMDPQRISCTVNKTEIALVDGDFTLINTTEPKPNLLSPWIQVSASPVQVSNLNISGKTIVSACLRTIAQDRTESAWYCKSQFVPFTPPPDLSKPATPTVQVNFKTQYGFDASWITVSHPVGIKNYEIILQQNGSTIYNTTGTTVSGTFQLNLPIALYTIGVRAVTNNNIAGDYGYTPLNITQADQVYHVNFSWQIYSQLSNYTNYKTATCTQRMDVFYSVANNIYNTYSSCTRNQNGYAVTIACPLISYNLGPFDYSYYVPLNVSRVKNGRAFIMGLYSYETGLCGTLDITKF